MASKFTAGMTNVVQVLNEMWAAFAAGPYNALPLTGGTLTGPVSSTSTITASRVMVGDPNSAAQGFISSVPSESAAGAANEVARYGVGGTSGQAHNGLFSWLTRNSLNGIAGKGGYVMSIRAYDAGSAQFSNDLWSLTGAGDMAVAGAITAGNILPTADAAYVVGTAAQRFATIYAATGTINTSDARLKTDFRDLTPAEIAAARDLARAIAIYRWRDAVDCKGAGAREHVGPTVQTAIEIMQAHDLDPFNYGFICHDAWEQQTVDHPAIEAQPAVPAAEAAPEVLDSNGAVITPAVPASPGYPAIEARAAYTEVVLDAGERYAFRYDELAMFIAAGQEARLAALEAVA